MKNIIYKVIFGTIFSICILPFFSNCSSQTNEKTAEKEKPLNITVFIDLSDRLIKNGTSQFHDETTQMTRDTTIISQIEDIFIKETIQNNGLIKSTNHFQVLFYPAPNSSQINALAADLNIDLAKASQKEKRQLLNDMKAQFSNALGAIYTQTIKDKAWVGCDIWGFFSNKKVDQICVKEGYRNILVILTDGYLFHVNNKIKEGNSYSYILDQTLAQENSSLLVKRRGLNNLEVLMLEINPTDPKNLTKMTSILESWFREMGIIHFVVADTDVPQNVTPVIDSFFNDIK